MVCDKPVVLFQVRGLLERSVFFTDGLETNIDSGRPLVIELTNLSDGVQLIEIGDTVGRAFVADCSDVSTDVVPEE